MSKIESHTLSKWNLKSWNTFIPCNLLCFIYAWICNSSAFVNS